MMYTITCDGPGPHDPADGILGTSPIEDQTGRCASPSCQPLAIDDLEMTANAIELGAAGAVNRSFARLDAPTVEQLADQLRHLSETVNRLIALIPTGATES